MPRPTVLVATTSPAMAYALKERLSQPCRKLGLKLEICPEGGQHNSDLGIKAYESAEDLFDCLAARNPMILGDTLVILDVGVALEHAFQPAVIDDCWWHVTKQRRAGVALELVLRFPQVFPVFLSPSVPTEDVSDNIPEYTNVVAPELKTTSDGKWANFTHLVDSLKTAHRSTGIEPENIASFDALKACCVPMHFVSPLDNGVGLISTLTRFARGMRCWFDPTGLRTLVKNYFLGILFGSQDEWGEKNNREILRERLDRVAIAVDEEREFAVLNTYTSYKFGRRAWMVTTFAEFDDMPLWVDNPSVEQIVQDVVVLRDIDLRFPDIPDDAVQGRELSIRNHVVPARDQLKLVNSPIWELCKDKTTPKLYDCNWTIRCVSSHQNIENPKSYKEKLGQEPSSKPIKIEPDDHIFYGSAKPIASLYDLRQFVATSGDINTMSSRLKSTKEKSSGGHGAPYLNLAIAESLLQQATNCEKGPVENLIGSLLACEAYELLLGMSKTTALEALMLMHKKEVAAETGFPGVSQDIDISPRRRDIEASLGSLFGEGNSKNSRRTRYLFLSRFWADLRPLYRDAELFEPAEAANRESLIFAQWMPRRIRDKFDWNMPDDVVRIFLKIKYGLVQVATNPYALIFTTIAVWLLSICIYGEWEFDPSRDGFVYFGVLLKGTILTSLGLQPDDILKTFDGWRGWWVVVHVGFSYALFGILISMLYRKITRS